MRSGVSCRDGQPGRVLINAVLTCPEQANQVLMSLGLTVRDGQEML